MENSIIPTLSLQSLRLFTFNNYHELFPRKEPSFPEIIAAVDDFAHADFVMPREVVIGTGSYKESSGEVYDCRKTFAFRFDVPSVIECDNYKDVLVTVSADEFGHGTAYIDRENVELLFKGLFNKSVSLSRPLNDYARDPENYKEPCASGIDRYQLDVLVRVAKALDRANGGNAAVGRVIKLGKAIVEKVGFNDTYFSREGHLIDARSSLYQQAMEDNGETLRELIESAPVVDGKVHNIHPVTGCFSSFHPDLCVVEPDSDELLEKSNYLISFSALCTVLNYSVLQAFDLEFVPSMVAIALKANNLLDGLARAYYAAPCDSSKPDLLIPRETAYILFAIFDRGYRINSLSFYIKSADYAAAKFFAEGRCSGYGLGLLPFEISLVGTTADAPDAAATPKTQETVVASTTIAPEDAAKVAQGVAETADAIVLNSDEPKALEPEQVQAPELGAPNLDLSAEANRRLGAAMAAALGERDSSLDAEQDALAKELQAQIDAEAAESARMGFESVCNDLETADSADPSYWGDPDDDQEFDSANVNADSASDASNGTDGVDMSEPLTPEQDALKSAVHASTHLPVPTAPISMAQDDQGKDLQTDFLPDEWRDWDQAVAGVYIPNVGTVAILPSDEAAGDYGCFSDVYRDSLIEDFDPESYVSIVDDPEFVELRDAEDNALQGRNPYAAESGVVANSFGLDSVQELTYEKPMLKPRGWGSFDFETTNPYFNESTKRFEVDLKGGCNELEHFTLKGIVLRFIPVEPNMYRLPDGGAFVTFGFTNSRKSTLVDVDSFFKAWLNLLHEKIQGCDVAELYQFGQKEIPLTKVLKRDLFRLVLDWGGTFVPLQALLRLSDNYNSILLDSALFCLRVGEVRVKNAADVYAA